MYDKWLPKNFTRLCSVIDDLQSNPDFNVPLLWEGTGLSQCLKVIISPDRTPTQPRCSREMIVKQTLSGSQDVTPNTSFTQLGPFKKPRIRPSKSGAWFWSTIRSSFGPGLFFLWNCEAIPSGSTAHGYVRTDLRFLLVLLLPTVKTDAPIHSPRTMEVLPRF